MGKGNVCVHGTCECLYYIDNDDFHTYYLADDPCDYKIGRDMTLEDYQSGEWKFADLGTEMEFEEIIEDFAYDFKQKFPSFENVYSENRFHTDRYSCFHWQDHRVVLENKLFMVCLTDNEWSVAVELLQKEAPYGYSYEGLQSKHFDSLRDGMLDCLLNQLGTVYMRNGAWMSTAIIRGKDGKPTAKLRGM